MQQQRFDLLTTSNLQLQFGELLKHKSHLYVAFHRPFTVQTKATFTQTLEDLAQRNSLTALDLRLAAKERQGRALLRSHILNHIAAKYKLAPATSPVDTIHGIVGSHTKFFVKKGNRCDATSLKLLQTVASHTIVIAVLRCTGIAIYEKEGSLKYYEDWIIDSLISGFGRPPPPIMWREFGVKRAPCVPCDGAREQSEVEGSSKVTTSYNKSSPPQSPPANPREEDHDAFYHTKNSARAPPEDFPRSSFGVHAKPRGEEHRNDDERSIANILQELGIDDGEDEEQHQSPPLERRGRRGSSGRGSSRHSFLRDDRDRDEMWQQHRDRDEMWQQHRDRDEMWPSHDVTEPENDDDALDISVILGKHHM